MKSKNKIWQLTRNNFRRRSGALEVRDRILIVCEGEKTEPNYFKKFPIKRGRVELKIEGTGYNCVSLVEEAIRLKEEAMREKRLYNQIWCVFDKDDFSDDQFNKACILAENNKIGVAYSNQAFELWYILHFCYCDAALSRSQYIVKLTAYIGHKYEKNSEDMYDELKQLQNNAIKHAEKLSSSHRIINPAKNDPSTKVNSLVNALNNFM